MARTPTISPAPGRAPGAGEGAWSVGWRRSATTGGVWSGPVARVPAGAESWASSTSRAAPEACAAGAGARSMARTPTISPETPGARGANDRARSATGRRSTTGGARSGPVASPTSRAASPAPVTSLDNLNLKGVDRQRPPILDCARSVVYLGRHVGRPRRGWAGPGHATDQRPARRTGQVVRVRVVLRPSRAAVFHRA